MSWIVILLLCEAKLFRKDGRKFWHSEPSLFEFGGLVHKRANRMIRVSLLNLSFSFSGGNLSSLWWRTSLYGTLAWSWERKHHIQLQITRPGVKWLTSGADASLWSSTGGPDNSREGGVSALGQRCLKDQRVWNQLNWFIDIFTVTKRRPGSMTTFQTGGGNEEGEKHRIKHPVLTWRLITFYCFKNECNYICNYYVS